MGFSRQEYRSEKKKKKRVLEWGAIAYIYFNNKICLKYVFNIKASGIVHIWKCWYTLETGSLKSTWVKIKALIFNTNLFKYLMRLNIVNI